MGDKTSRGRSQTAILDYRLRGNAVHAVNEARRLYDQYKSGELPSLYTPISEERLEGLEGIADIARSGGGPGYQEYARTVGGDYLGEGNPYLDEIVSRSVGESLRAMPGAYASGGRFGSGAYANAVADAAQETAARLYGASYESERNRMMQALGMAPVMDYAPETALMGVGAAYEEDERQRQLEEMRQYEAPLRWLQDFQNQLATSPLAAESETVTTARQPFDWQSALGALLGGICHAAAEFFGWHTPKWFAARWAIQHLPAGLDFLRDWYEEHSVELARVIREDPEVRERWRPLFDFFAEFGEAEGQAEYERCIATFSPPGNVPRGTSSGEASHG